MPDITGRDVFICGPPAFAPAVLETQRRLGVPNRQIHADLFRLAGG